MRKFLNLIEKHSERLYFFSLCLIIISFPFSVALNSISMGIILLLFILDYKNIKDKLTLYISQRKNILLLVLFASIFVSLSYSQNTAKGVAKVIGYLPFIALPVAMTRLHQLPSEQTISLKRLYIVICVLASLTCLILATFDSGLINGSYKGQVAPNLYTAYFVHRFTYHELSEQINLHAIYFSLFIAVALILGVEEIKVSNRNRQFFLVFVMCFLSGILFLLKSVVINFAFYSFILIYLFLHFSFGKLVHHILFYSIALIATFLNFYLYILKEVGSFEQNTYLFEDSDWNKKFLIALAFSLVMAITVVVFKRLFFKRRITALVALSAIGSTLFINFACQKNAQELYIEKAKGSGVNNVNARTGSWKGAWLIIKEHPWSGVGIGDTETSLIDKYKEINFTTGAQQQFNAHNQYLEFWASSGIVAILCFVLLLFSEGYQAYINRNIVLAGLLYLFLVFCFTESVLNRQMGRVFFIFFLCLLSSNHNASVSKTDFS